LWKQLVVAAPDAGDARPSPRTDAIVAFCLAVAAALLVKAPALFGLSIDEASGFYARNAGLFVLPLLTGYFAWKRRLAIRTGARLAAAFVASAVFANVYPFAPGSNTEALLALHLPIALWLLVGIAYAGGRWSDVAARMDFIRFSGELFIYYVLIALGGGVLTAFMAMIFHAIGVDVEPFFESWLLPCGAAGAVLIASWLVEAKQSVIENMAPVLTSLFAPLFDRLRPAAGGRARPAAVFDLGSRRAAAARPRRHRADRPGHQRAAGRRGRAVGDCRAHQRVRSHSEPRRGRRRERDPAGVPRLVGGAVCPLPGRARRVRRARTVADQLPSRVCRLGRDRRDRLPAVVRLPLNAGATLDGGPDGAATRRGPWRHAACSAAVMQRKNRQVGTVTSPSMRSI
jgi:hypothetical protein